MGTGAKICSVIFRLGELVSAIIVLAIVGRFLYLLHLGHGSAESRIIYAEVMAGISTAFSILLVLPAMYSFYAFPLDFALFVCWIVCFGLLDSLSGGHACSSYWYWSYWGYYWGRFWVSPHDSVTLTVVGDIGCGEWRTILAFSFIGSMCWLANSIIGAVVVASKTIDSTDTTHTSSYKKPHWYSREKRSNAQVPPETTTV